jgi:DNA-directed RNA polymerase specialized sigma24 family protein
MEWIHPERSVDASPIALLYDCYAHHILTYVSRFALSEHDADDLVLEVFLAAMEKPVWVTWSDKEIAQRLNTSDNVVRVSLSRALAYLRGVYQHRKGEQL